MNATETVAGMYTAEQRLIRLADRVNTTLDEIDSLNRDLERAWERHDRARAEYDQRRRELDLPLDEESA